MAQSFAWQAVNKLTDIWSSAVVRRRRFRLLHAAAEPKLCEGKWTGVQEGFGKMKRFEPNARVFSYLRRMVFFSGLREKVTFLSQIPTDWQQKCFAKFQARHCPRFVPVLRMHVLFRTYIDMKLRGLKFCLL